MPARSPTTRKRSDHHQTKGRIPPMRPFLLAGATLDPGNKSRTKITTMSPRDLFPGSSSSLSTIDNVPEYRDDPASPEGSTRTSRRRGPRPTFRPPHRRASERHSAVSARHAASGAAREIKRTRRSRGPRPTFRPRHRRRSEGHRRGFSAVMPVAVCAVRSKMNKAKPRTPANVFAAPSQVQPRS